MQPTDDRTGNDRLADDRTTDRRSGGYGLGAASQSGQSGYDRSARRSYRGSRRGAGRRRAAQPGADGPGADGPGADGPGADGPGASERGTSDSGARRGPSAYNTALNLLAMRGHSRAELAGRLARKGFEPEVIEAALVRLERARLLDDAAFAASFAASRAARGVAATVIRRDLAAKGVDGALAARAAAEASPAETEAARCRDLAAAWLERRPELPAPVAARRLAGYLARRGYSPGAIVGAVRALTGGDVPGDTDRSDDPDDRPA
jgi:regulatory protein